MAYSLSELRNIGLNESTAPDPQVFTEATIAQMILDEAYYGRKQVAKVQKAMDNLRNVYLENPNLDIKNMQCNRELEKAIQDAFGFKRCTVYWTNSIDMSTGPYTVPIAHIYSEDGTYIKIGSNPNGYYDHDHKINIVVSSDLCLFAEPYNLTSEEMVAIFLHEIGHNFDYSCWGIIKGWLYIFDNLMDLLAELLRGNVGGAIGVGIATVLGSVLKNAPELMVNILNFGDLALNAVPPIAQIVRGVGRAVNPIKKLLKTITSQSLWVTSIPITISRMPFRMFDKVLLRKGEVYADSFAAAYGYGPEQIRSLEKLTVERVQTSIDIGPITQVFNDLTLLQEEVWQTCYMGHGSALQRGLRMSDVLTESLKKSGLSNADKAAIMAEQKRIEATYQRYVNMDDYQRNIMTRAFRQMVDNWYNGKPYVFIPNIDKNYVG